MGRPKLILTPEQEEERRQKRNAYMKTRYHKDPEKSRQYHRDWNATHAQDRKRYSKEYYAKDAERIKNRSRIYYLEHREERLAYQKVKDTEKRRLKKNAIKIQNE